MNHLQQIAQSYEDYTTAYNAGQISPAEYKSLLEVLRDPIFEEYPIKWGNVTPYREIALHYE